MTDEREQRNAVFGQPPQGIDPRMPSISAAEKVKADFGLDIPAETVPLPSAGKVYPATSSLAGLEVVDIRPMSAREEDILTSRALLKKGTVVTELIRSCLIDRSIDPTQLLTGDRNALMVAIRITGYGADYEVEVECPDTDCSVKSKHMFDLSQLPIRRLELEPVSAGSNLFEFKLPRTGKVVKFRFLTGKDEEDIVATQDRQKKLNLTQGDTAVTSNLLYSIVAIDGVEDRSKIAGFIRAMPAGDSLALRTYIRDNEPGITMKQGFTCPACGHSEEVVVGLTTEFLWPSAGR